MPFKRRPFSVFTLSFLDVMCCGFGADGLPLAFQLAKLERVGIFLVIGVLFLLPLIGRQLGINLSISPWLIEAPVEYLLRVIATLAGLE